MRRYHSRHLSRKLRHRSARQESRDKNIVTEKYHNEGDQSSSDAVGDKGEAAKSGPTLTLDQIWAVIVQVRSAIIMALSGMWLAPYLEDAYQEAAVVLAHKHAAGQAQFFAPDGVKAWMRRTTVNIARLLFKKDLRDRSSNPAVHEKLQPDRRVETPEEVLSVGELMVVLSGLPSADYQKLIDHLKKQMVTSTSENVEPPSKVHGPRVRRLRRRIATFLRRRRYR